MRRSALLILITTTSWAALVAQGTAGTYSVVACGDAATGQNNSWTPSNSQPSHLSVVTACPPGTTSLDSYDGLLLSDQLGASSAPSGSQAAQIFAAPAATTIRSWSYDRWIGKDTDNDWTAYVRIDNGAALDTCNFSLPQTSCSEGVPVWQQGGRTTLTALSATQLTFGIRCDAPGGVNCATGSTIRRVWATVYATTVTLEENTPPSVGAPSGDLVDSGWHQGTEDVRFTASDGSPGVGIKETRVYVDGVQRGSVAQACDFTFTVPCSNPSGQITHAVDTTAVSDGERQVEAAAIDAAGNETRSSPVTVRFDNNPPGNLTVAANAAGSEINVSWSASDGSGSGVQTYDVEVSDTGAPYAPWLTATTQTSQTYTATPGGNYFFRVRARDQVGHLSGFVASGQVTVPPVPTAPSPPAPTSGSPPPPNGDGAPPASDDPTRTTRMTPALRIRSTRRHGSRLLVAGTVPRAATGEVTMTYAARGRGRARRLRRTARVRDARFRAVLPLPPELRSATRATLTVRYSGDARYRPRTLRKVFTR